MGSDVADHPVGAAVLEGVPRKVALLDALHEIDLHEAGLDVPAEYIGILRTEAFDFRVERLARFCLLQARIGVLERLVLVGLLDFRPLVRRIEDPAAVDVVLVGLHLAADVVQAGELDAREQKPVAIEGELDAAEVDTD